MAMVNKTLELKNGVLIRSLEELQEHYDIDQVMQYFQDGSLITWLDNLYYEEEADALRALDRYSPNLKDELSAILIMTNGDSRNNYKTHNEEPAGIIVEGNDPDELCRTGYEASERGDYNIALAYLEKSASLGHEGAANTLGCLYAGGKGTSVDFQKAMYWFKKAAEKNQPAALFNVGLMYEDGEGVPTNINEAVKWYDKAVEYGHPGALERLNALSLTGKINRAYNNMGFHYDEHVINAVKQSIGGDNAMRSFVQSFDAGDRNAKRTARELGRACNYYLPVGGTPEDNAWDVVYSIKAYLASKNYR